MQATRANSPNARVRKRHDLPRLGDYHLVIFVDAVSELTAVAGAEGQDGGEAGVAVGRAEVARVGEVVLRGFDEVGGVGVGAVVWCGGVS